MLRRPAQDCSSYTLSFDTTVFIIESTRRRVAVEATLENRGENAYSAVLNISQSENLQFASLIQKVGPPRLTRLTWANGRGVEEILTELCPVPPPRGSHWVIYTQVALKTSFSLQHLELGIMVIPESASFENRRGMSEAAMLALLVSMCICAHNCSDPQGSDS